MYMHSKRMELLSEVDTRWDYMHFHVSAIDVQIENRRFEADVGGEQ